MGSEDDDACHAVDIDHAPDYYTCSYLSVPIDRRHSSVTCSSGDSSYLERRGSAFEMGLPAPPCCSRGEKIRLPASEEPWDFYYPIDIQVDIPFQQNKLETKRLFFQVIQPTPEMSPSVSEQTLYEEAGKLTVSLNVHSLQVPSHQDRMHRLTVDRSEMGIVQNLNPSS